MEIDEILKCLPHRQPFLLVDRVLSCEPFKSITALKNVSFNEPFFEGHFPGHPVMPGVLVIEAMAQATAILGYRSYNMTVKSGLMFYFAGIDQARFKRMVKPGDQLLLTIDIITMKQKIWKVKAKATVEGELACEAILLCAGRVEQGEKHD